MPLIVPHLAIGSGDEITIDGVTYKVPLIDSGGRLYTNAYATGASEVTAARAVLTSTVTRTTLVTPPTGKQIRVASVQLTFDNTGGQRAEVYFGDGANMETTLTKAIAEVHNGSLAGTYNPVVWPDGGGPVGAADDVLSIRLAVNLAQAVRFIVHYREE